MRLLAWEKLPPEMQCDEIRPYYDALKKKKFSLFCKRVFDIVASFTLLLLLSPFFVLLTIAIKLDSKGPVFYRQVRVTQYGKTFRIHKFRSMCADADRRGTLVTVDGDSRITRVGKFIRKFRLDEISQLLDVLDGNMTFVGVRPEVPKYVEHYTPEMRATLLLPAGVTNLACIRYKDEARLLSEAENADEQYINVILPEKMKYNLAGIKNFHFFGDIKLCIMTVLAVLKRDH